MNKLQMFEIVQQRDVLDIRDKHTDMKNKRAYHLMLQLCSNLKKIIIKKAAFVNMNLKAGIGIFAPLNIAGSSN